MLEFVFGCVAGLVVGLLIAWYVWRYANRDREHLEHEIADARRELQQARGARVTPTVLPSAWRPTPLPPAPRDLEAELSPVDLPDGEPEPAEGPGAEVAVQAEAAAPGVEVADEPTMEPEVAAETVAPATSPAPAATPPLAPAAAPATTPAPAAAPAERRSRPVAAPVQAAPPEQPPASGPPLPAPPPSPAPLSPPESPGPPEPQSPPEPPAPTEPHARPSAEPPPPLEAPRPRPPATGRRGPAPERRAPAPDAFVARATLAERWTTASDDVSEIQGIGPAFQARLAAAGIATIGGLLSAGSTPADRDSIAASCHIRVDLVQAWVYRADLMRVSGINPQVAELLELAGVLSTGDLASRDPALLHALLEPLNESRHIAPQVPTSDTLRRWVEAARDLPIVVTH
jgi:predicted flap endonuclease-1-like 5' DNA nuclease